MCLAIYKPSESRISEEVLKTGFKRNPDGAGIVASVDDKMIRYRTLKDFKSFYNFYKKYEDNSMMIHFRWATIGEISESNIHPFLIKNNLFMCHNGNFHNKGNNIISDTRDMCNTISKIDNIEKVLRNKNMIKQLESLLKFQKVILMDNKDFYIFNESYGNWKDGVWYSNSTGFESLNTKSLLLFNN